MSTPPPLVRSLRCHPVRLVETPSEVGPEAKHLSEYAQWGDDQIGSIVELAYTVEILRLADIPRMRLTQSARSRLPVPGGVHGSLARCHLSVPSQ